MVLDQGRLTPSNRPTPRLGPRDLLVRVRACGVCRTDLHLLDGDLPTLGPIVPGHEVVGVVEALGGEVRGWAIGQRVGVAWLGGTCGRCPYCRGGDENLCDAPVFTGWTRDGGYAELMAADARYCLPIPDGLDDIQAAPLLCAGLIGFRAWRMACAQARVERVGVYGFGAAGHLLAQLAVAEGRTVLAFTRPGDLAAQALARKVGCAWVGDSTQAPPQPLDAAILFAPVGALVPIALRAVRKGGVVVCGGIHMSQIPAFDYSDLWGERRIVSVANLTRQDGRDYLARAAAAKVRAEVMPYRLDQAAEALRDLREGKVVGAGVLILS